MSALSTRWEEWTGKFAALTRRERAIVSAALVFGGGFLIYSFAIDPFLQKAGKAATAELAARTELAQQDALMAMLKAQDADPDAANRSRLARTRQELALASERLARFEAGMVPPARMQAFLEGLLAKNRAIELLSLKTLPVTLIGAPTAAPNATAAAGASAQVATDPAGDKPAQGGAVAAEGIYQHGIEITLAGSYNDLLKYLGELEQMPQHVMWNSVSLKVDKHPRNVMVLRVHTLSLDRDWLVV